MKKLFLIAVFFVAFVGYSKAVPSPTVFFNISEKILEGAHQFVFPNTKVTSKILPKKVESQAKIDNAAKSQDALESLWNPRLTVRREGIWVLTR